MSKINFAATRRVNPPEALLKLTEEQVWKGLELKARDPQNFIAAVTSCNIIKDEGNKLVRKIFFEKGAPVQEEVTFYKGTIVYFDAPTEGHHVTNTLSYDKDNELNLTFSFAGGVPGGLPATIHEAVPSAAELNTSIGDGVDRTIDRIRELVQEGALD